MAYQFKWQTNFTSGEISDSLAARTDLKQYNNSCASINNFIVRPQGGLIKRPGTYFVAEVRNSSFPPRLIPFQYSTVQSYMLEVGAGYIRFYKNGGQVLSTTAVTNGTFASSLTGWTTANTGTGTAVWDAGIPSMKLSGGSSGVGAAYQQLMYAGIEQYTVTFTVSTNACVYKIGSTIGGSDIATGTAAAGGTTTVNFTLGAAGNPYLQFSNANNNNSFISNVSISSPIYTLDNPYAQNELDAISFCQSYDVLFFVHGNHAPYSIIRHGDAQWTNGAVTFLDGPYYDITDPNFGGTGTGINMTPSAFAVGAATMTASAAIFKTTDVGRPIRYRNGATAAWGWAVITAFTSSTLVSINIKQTFVSAGASPQWRLGAWSADPLVGFPSTASFFQQRFCLAGSEGQQQTIWFSQAGSIFNMQPDSDFLDDTADDSAMTYTIADSESNVIEWLAPHTLLYVGTSGGIWVAGQQGVSAPLTPTSITILPGIDETAASVVPIIFRSSLLYVQYYGRRFLEATYSYLTNLYTAADLAIMAENRTKGLLSYAVKQMSPNYVIWFMCQDGSMCTLTYVKDQSINAWTNVQFGGPSPQVLSLAVIPGDTQDQPWFIVQRTINGFVVQYIEYLSDTYLDDATIANCNFMDCSFTYSGAPTSTLTGLGFLVGLAVTVYDKGGFVIPTTGPVSPAGHITLANGLTTTSCIVGLPYVSSFTTNEIDIDTKEGSSTGKVARIQQITLKMMNTYGGSIGVSDTSMDTIPFISSLTNMDGSITPFTGNRNLEVPSPYTRTPVLYYEHDGPFPCHILGIALKATISDK